jgi:N-formylmaleamate deformylase
VAGSDQRFGHLFAAAATLVQEVAVSRALALFLTVGFACAAQPPSPPTVAPPSPRSFTVEVTGQGPPVVLIPGLACTGAVWSTTVARYRRHHRLHVLTLAGFGESRSIEGPFLPTVRAELAAYLRAHVPGKPVIVGHSLGGFLALWLAASEPDLIGGVVVVDAVPFLAAEMLPDATVETARPMAEQMRTMLGRATPDEFAVQNQGALATMITDPANIAPIAEMGRRSSPAAVATAIYELMTTDLRPLLHAIRVPTLVLAANDADPAAYAAQYTALAGHRLVVAARARHFIMIDDPGFLFAHLDRVLGE